MKCLPLAVIAFILLWWLNSVEAAGEDQAKSPIISPEPPVRTPVAPEKGRYGGDTSVGIGLDGKPSEIDDSPTSEATADDPIFNARFVVEGVGVISIPDAPVEWGAQALAVFQCESGWRPGVVGPGGYGIPQVGPIHFPAMRQHGLDPNSEQDLIQYAYWLYVWHGWRVPWVHCGPLAEGAQVVAESGEW